jgi:HlyD family secretion protein
MRTIEHCSSTIPRHNFNMETPPSNHEPKQALPKPPLGSPVSNRPRAPQKRYAPLIATLLLVAAGGAFAWWMSGRSATQATVAISATEMATAAIGNVESSVESSGKVISNLDVDIKCRASGEVTTLPFDISQNVKKGDLLCQLDPTDARLAVRLAQAVVVQATAKLAQARNDLELAELSLGTTRRRYEASLTAVKVKATNLRAKANRQNELMQQSLGSREEMEAAQTEAATAENDLNAAQIAIDELKQQEIQIQYKRQAVNMAEAQLQSDQITLDTQKQQLAYTTVTAPLDAVVSALNVQKGTIVASGVSGFSGGTTIMTLSDLSRVFVTATVDESDIGSVRVGQKARISIASFPSIKFDGQVVRIAVMGVNSSNVVTFEVKVEILDARKSLLRPQMTGNVTIIESQRADVLTLPSAAVTRNADHAYVVMADGRQRPVTLGLQGSETVEITSGLNEGERVRVLTAELPTRWKSESSGPPTP